MWMKRSKTSPWLLLASGLLALALLAAPAALAAVQRVGDASASFTGKGPGGFKLEGHTGELRLEDAGALLRIIVPLAHLETGIDLRDRHMREKYLEVQKYPDAVLEVPWGALKLPEDGKASTGEAHGKLTLHGRTKELPFQYTVQRTGAAYQVSGSLPLNLKDFGIEVPSYMGVTVKPDIQTAVRFGATKS